jgi:hypothetical protein
LGITYSAGTGTTITSFVMNETLGDQTQQSNNNTVVVSDSMTNLENGQIGDGTNGIGATYVGRLVIIDLGLSTQQVRMCTAETAGTGTTYILTVHEDWDTNPVTTTDTIHVCYELADVEDGAASGGIGLGSKTGLWELSNDLIVGDATNVAGLQIVNGAALETDDNGAAINSYVENNGYLFMGYEGAESPINGGVCTAYNNAAAEPWMQFKSGSVAYIYDSFFWAQLVAQKLEMVSGAATYWWGSKIFSGTQELLAYDASFVECTISGRAAGTSEVVRVNSGTSSDGLVLSQVDTLDTVADTVTETIELAGVIFSGVTDLINVRNNKTWNMIDPVWNATTYTDFTWVGTTSNEINDRRSVKAIIQESDGTKLQNALVIIHEETQLADLVLELVSDTNGAVDGSFIYKKHSTGSTTTTYGGHALRIDKWLYTPFIVTQTSTEAVSGAFTLIDDSNIVQTTQATALTAGSGITWNEDTNPSSIIEFASGTGTLTAGDTVTGSTSGATGVVTDIIDGDSSAGTVHLKTRSATDFSGTEGLSNGTGWTATLVSGSQQDYSIWVDGNSLSLQTIHDYFAALTSETTLTATGELIHEWGRDSQGRALYLSGSDFYTSRSYTKGVIVVNYGSGNVSGFNDDAGVDWVPPTQVTLTIEVIDEAGDPVQNAQCSIHVDEAPPRTELLNTDSSALGIATAGYTYVADVDIIYKVRKSDDLDDPRYRAESALGAITSSGFYVLVTLKEQPLPI